MIILNIIFIISLIMIYIKNAIFISIYPYIMNIFYMLNTDSFLIKIDFFNLL
jgi:hypothetical protein